MCIRDRVHMARRPRAHAESGFYHVILKGSGSQIIFEDDSDRRSFLSYLDTYRRAFDVRIIAWCLMSNHVHLIISDEADALSDFMHSLTSAYACKFNRRHQRTGPLFNGRFHSVAITSEGQLLNAVRYVHDNPVKGGICPAPVSYTHLLDQALRGLDPGVDEEIVSTGIQQLTVFDRYNVERISQSICVDASTIIEPLGLSLIHI